MGFGDGAGEDIILEKSRLCIKLCDLNWMKTGFMDIHAFSVYTI